MTLSVSIQHRRGDFDLDAAFEALPTGITALFGPSGAGKTTILAAIAGLLRPRHAEVSLSGERLDLRPPQRRRIGLVFQDSRLFPAMSVRANLLYGMRRISRYARREREGHFYWDETIALLALQDLLHRRPATLSGGERQRVAIGRALLSQPRLLLMDEPLSGLDAGLRDSVMPYLLRLRDTLSLPMIYVTHAYTEVMRLADRLVLLDQGRVLAQGPMHELAARADLPLAARPDAAGVLIGMLHSHDEERRLSGVACGGGLFAVALQPVAPGTPVRLRVPARDVMLSRDAPRLSSVDNVVAGHVVAVADTADGKAVLVEMETGGGMLLARITADAAARLSLRRGAPVFAMIQALSVQVLA